MTLLNHYDSSTAKEISFDASPEDVFVFPASFAQQRLWFLDQLEPGSSTYNIPAAFCLRGPLNVIALEQSLIEIVQRHEVLRTVFAAVEGQPVQRITSPASLPLAVVDLRELPEAKREAEVRQLATEEAQRPFNLAQGALFRASLLQLDKEEHVLLLTMHHIISDGWSMGVLFRELTALYEAYSYGKPSPLPELPIQYADFACWQRQWLQREVLERELSYWKGHLAGLPVLELSTDHPRPAVQTYRGARQSVVLPKGLTEVLKKLSQREGVTLYMTLRAAFQTLLYRYTGHDDIVVGSPIAGRNQAKTEELIGFFVNTLVLRSDLSGNPTFHELLGRVREVALGAYAHQELPFEKLVEELNPDRDPSRSPLFQVLFALQNAPMSPMALQGLTVTPLRVGSETAKFDLTLSIADKEQGLYGTLQYNTDLFEGDTISRMLGHFQTLLEGMVTDPDQRLSDLPILTDMERRQLLVEWNDTTTEYPDDKCIHQLFESQVERTPDSVAVVFPSTGSGHSGEEQLTYRELNCHANQLAHYLKGRGVGPKVLVGICMERSLEMIIGLLAILKAGGAYVPLDPVYPKERLAFMLKDTQAPVLLTQERLMTNLPIQNPKSEIQNPVVVCLDTDWKAIARQSNENPVSEVTANNLAYVIYTSGSTGKPKGVMIEHKNVVNYLCWVKESLLGNTVDSLPIVTGLSFDASLKQLFALLLRGGELWILSSDVVTQPVALLQALGTKTRVGLNCVPSFWAATLDVINSGQTIMPPESLTCLFVGGERLSKELVDNTLNAIPNLQIWNLYGPTEATANASVTKIASDGDVTIGRPIANTQIHILDSHLQPVPVGVPGELHIGGAALARGYLNRPELTAEKFIPNPFSPVLSEVKGDEPSARLYKTGDMARYLPDGNIEFLGRIDNQVKIRGFRIELGEIEAVLGQHPAVRENVVISRENSPGDKHLVSYVVANQQRPLIISDLRRFLKEKLPNHMVPSAFVVLVALPLTPNGKVDRLALPAPDQTRPDLEGAFVAPRSPVEKELARIWIEVLKLEQVGIQDNFFELGGHSLLATQVISRVREAFQVELPLRILFEKPTIEELAMVIEETLMEEIEKLTENDAQQLLERGV